MYKGRRMIDELERRLMCVIMSMNLFKRESSLGNHSEHVSTLRLHKVKLSPEQAVEAYRVVRC
jgi:hypothetical protein